MEHSVNLPEGDSEEEANLEGGKKEFKLLLKYSGPR